MEMRSKLLVLQISDPYSCERGVVGLLLLLLLLFHAYISYLLFSLPVELCASENFETVTRFRSDMDKHARVSASIFNLKLRESEIS